MSSPPPKYCTELSSFNDQLARRVSAGLAAVMEQGEPAVAATAPCGHRLYHQAIFTHDYSNAFMQPSAVDGMRRITLIVDFSGSMLGMWTGGGGAEFVWGMMQFARSGGCHLQVVLTGGDRGPAELPVDTPMNVYDKLSPHHGQESFARTMENPAVLELMENSDLTICWTDGQLTDGYVDAIRWRERNINVVGATLGDPDSSAYHATKGCVKLHEAMCDYFHASFIDSDVARIATRLATWVAAAPLRDLQ